MLKGTTTRFSLIERLTDDHGNNLLEPNYDLKITVNEDSVILNHITAQNHCAPVYQKLLAAKKQSNE